MSYKIVYDKAEVIKFFNLFFSDLNEDPMFVQFLYLASRRKYDTEMKLHEGTCFERKIVKYADADYFYRLIKGYEVPLGTYTQRDGTPVSQKALVLYCTLNPRSMLKGWFALSSKMGKQIENYVKNPARSASAPRSGAEEKVKFFKNLNSELKSCVHASVGEKRYVEIDVDTKEPEMLGKVISFLSAEHFLEDIMATIETRGGYHIIFKNDQLGKEKKSKLWKEFKKDEYSFQGYDVNGKPIKKWYAEIRSDAIEPVPGTIQGGFEVKFVDILSI